MWQEELDDAFDCVIPIPTSSLVGVEVTAIATVSSRYLLGSYHLIRGTPWPRLHRSIIAPSLLRIVSSPLRPALTGIRRRTGTSVRGAKPAASGNSHVHQITTGIGSITGTGTTTTRWTFWAMMAIRQGLDASTAMNEIRLRPWRSPPRLALLAPNPLIRPKAIVAQARPAQPGGRRRGGQLLSEPCGRRPSCRRRRPLAIAASVVPFGHGHHASHAEAIEQRQVSQPATCRDDREARRRS